MSVSTETIQKAILEGADGQPVLLQKVDIEASANGLLFSVKARQFCKSATEKNVETIYTFPLSWGCTLLGLTATIAGKTWQGTVLPKSEAEENYEKAIKDGDTPIMVEKSDEGLYTAHMGNLKPDVVRNRVFKADENRSCRCRSTTLLRRARFRECIAQKSIFFRFDI